MGVGTARPTTRGQWYSVGLCIPCGTPGTPPGPNSLLHPAPPKWWRPHHQSQKLLCKLNLPTYMTHCIIWTNAKGISKLWTEYEATKRWLRWLCWVWTQLPKPEYNVQTSSTWVELTLRACQGFNNFQETFPEVSSGTGNFPKVVGVTLKEAQVFSWFPLRSPNTYYCTV